MLARVRVCERARMYLPYIRYFFRETKIRCRKRYGVASDPEPSEDPALVPIRCSSLVVLLIVMMYTHKKRKNREKLNLNLRQNAYVRATTEIRWRETTFSAHSLNNSFFSDIFIISSFFTVNDSSGIYDTYRLRYLRAC